MSKEQAAFLAETADAIRVLAQDIVELGRLLTQAKARVGHGDWLRWLEREFGWTAKTAEKWMNVYSLSLKFELGSNFDLPLSALYALAEKSTPVEVREEIFSRAAAGEVISLAVVREARAAARSRLNPEALKICQTRRILGAFMVLGDEAPKCDLDNALIGKLRALPELRAALNFAARVEFCGPGRNRHF
jgi:Protein of unknown function (DUF3102)